MDSSTANVSNNNLFLVNYNYDEVKIETEFSFLDTVRVSLPALCLLCSLSSSVPLRFNSKITEWDVSKGSIISRKYGLGTFPC